MKETQVVLIEAGCLSPPSETLRNLLRFHAKDTPKTSLVYLSLTRSACFLTWQKEPRSDDLFPLPTDKLVWTKIILESGENPLNLFMAITKELADRFRFAFETTDLPLDGITVPFLTHVDWIFKQKSPPDNWVLIYEHDGAVDITAAHRNTPLFSRSLSGTPADEIENEIAAVVAYVQKSRPDYKPEQVIEVAGADLKGHEQILSEKKLFIPIPRRKHKVRALWEQQKRNILAGGSALLVLLSFFLHSRIDRVRTNLSALAHEEHQLQAGLRKPVSPVAGSDPAVGGLVSVINQAPRSLYLIDVRYDAAPPSFTIRGRSADYLGVSRFASGLSRQPNFSRVQIEKSSMVNAGGRDIVEFSAEARAK